MAEPGACSAIGQVPDPPAELGEGMDFSQQLIGRLVWMSYLSEVPEADSYTDPRTLSESAATEFDSVTNAILEQEASMMEALHRSRFYWVEMNPFPFVFLYAGAGALGPGRRGPCGAPSPTDPSGRD